MCSFRNFTFVVDILLEFNLIVFLIPDICLRSDERFNLLYISDWISAKRVRVDGHAALLRPHGLGCVHVEVEANDMVRVLLGRRPTLCGFQNVGTSCIVPAREVIGKMFRACRGCSAGSAIAPRLHRRGLACGAVYISSRCVLTMEALSLCSKSCLLEWLWGCRIRLLPRTR